MNNAERQIVVRHWVKAPLAPGLYTPKLVRLAIAEVTEKPYILVRIT
jgi:hypothetical protein